MYGQQQPYGQPYGQPMQQPAYGAQPVGMTKDLCPKDNARLVERRDPNTGIALDHCTVCGGTWFDGPNGELAAYVAYQVQQALQRQAQGHHVPTYQQVQHHHHQIASGHRPARRKRSSGFFSSFFSSVFSSS